MINNACDEADGCHSSRTFLSYKRQGPGEHVHEVRQPVRVWRAVKLTYVHHVVLVF